MVSGVCNFALHQSFILNSNPLLALLNVNTNKRISECFVFFDDILGIILNIWHWIITIWQYKLIIPRQSYYFKFIAFVLLPYIFPYVLNRQDLKSSTLIKLLKCNRYDKLRKKLCGLFVSLFPVFKNVDSMTMFG